jgi:hypothetical protein
MSYLNRTWDFIYSNFTIDPEHSELYYITEMILKNRQVKNLLGAISFVLLCYGFSILIRGTFKRIDVYKIESLLWQYFNKMKELLKEKEDNE